MSTKSYLLRIALAVLLLAVCIPMLWGLEEWIIVYDDEYTVTNNYEAVGMQGDSLALFNYQIQGRQFQITRQQVVPVFGTQALETIFSYDIDPAWGTITTQPRYFNYQNGKLYSAILTESKLLVFFTDTAQTDIHVFDRSGISSIGAHNDDGESGFEIRDESIGYFLAYQNQPFCYQYYALDFTTDTMQMFYQNSELLSYYLLNENYVLLSTQYTTTSGSILVDGATVIQVLGANYLGEDGGTVMNTEPFGSMWNQISLAHVLFPVGSNRNQRPLDNDLTYRDRSNSQTAYVHNQSIQLVTGGFVGSGRYFVPKNDSTFSCRVTDIDMWGYTIFDGFKKFYISAGQLYPDSSFPNLESYSNPWMLKAMGTNFLLAVCGNTDQSVSFVLADYAWQQITVQNYNLYLNQSSPCQWFTNERNVYIVSGSSVKVLHRDMITAVSDELAPVAPIGITAYPNPFSGVCKIAIDGTRNTPVKVSIYNIKGQLTKTLYQGLNPQGDGTLQWDGRNEQNQKAAAGVYWIKVGAGTASATRKIVLMH